MSLMWLLTALIISFFFGCGEANQKGVPRILIPGPFFPVNGTKLQVTCVAHGEKGAPSVSFMNPEINKEILNSTDGRLVIIVAKDEVKNETTATFTWNPIYVKDGEGVPLVQCRNKETKYSASFAIHVIPVKSVPKLSISSGSFVSVKRDGNLTISCEISAETNKYVERVSVLWKIDSLTSKEKLPPNVKIYTNNSMNASYAKSDLSISKASIVNEKTYFCIANLKINNLDELIRKYYVATKVNVTHDSGTESSKVEKIIVAGNTVTFDSKAYGIPIPQVEWKRNDVIITGDSDARYKFSGDKANNDASNRFLTIEKVHYSDRALFTCEIGFHDRNVTKSYRLRVRDPLGPLWPFIGMIIEAILLMIIIGGYQAYKNKIKKEKSKVLLVDGEGNIKQQSSEKSPLVKVPSRTSYTDDGVARQRNSKEA